jgi:hypothetical protein|tara:strand:+ start:308 stop:514 length:207 start_codon:yes stop_codon:yes gene_type:complete
MNDEYSESLDLVEIIDILKKLSSDINISSILKGNAEQIEIIAEMKERINSIEIERVSPVDFDMTRFEA